MTGDEDVKPSCGCVMCDLGLGRTKKSAGFGHYVPSRGIWLPCTRKAPWQTAGSFAPSPSRETS